MRNRWMALVECFWWDGVSNQCANRCARQAGFVDVTHGQQQEIEMPRKAATFGYRNPGIKKLPSSRYFFSTY
jgi:hypothetical protein